MSQFDIQFTFNGETISAISGQSVGAALLAAKQRTLRKTRFNQKGRGVFCGNGKLRSYAPVAKIRLPVLIILSDPW